MNGFQKETSPFVIRVSDLCPWHEMDSVLGAMQSPGVRQVEKVGCHQATLISRTLVSRAFQHLAVATLLRHTHIASTPSARGPHDEVNAIVSAAPASSMIHTSEAIVAWSTARHSASAITRAPVPSQRSMRTVLRARGSVPRTCSQCASIDKASQPRPIRLAAIAAISSSASGTGGLH